MWLPALVDRHVRTVFDRLGGGPVAPLAAVGAATPSAASASLRAGRGGGPVGVRLLAGMLAAGALGILTNNPLVKTADGATGGAVLGLLGLAGGWIGRSAGSRKRHDESYDQGVKDERARAEEARSRENAASNWRISAGEAPVFATAAPNPLRRTS